LEVFLVEKEGEYFTLERELEGGDVSFAKYNCNTGVEFSLETEIGQCMSAFTHWTNATTDGKIIVLDLKGNYLVYSIMLFTISMVNSPSLANICSSKHYLRSSAF
jgi:hypothetical protein